MRRLAPIRRSLAEVALGSIVPILVLVAWWLLTKDGESPFWPPLTETLETFRRDWMFDLVPSQLLPSLYCFAAGLGLASVVGIGLGLVLGSVTWLRDALAPVMDFLRAIPGAALIPAAVVLLGIGFVSRTAIVAFWTLWPILLNTIDGVRSVEPVLDEVAKCYRLRRRDRVWRIIVPAASPQIFSGLRVAIAVGFLAVVISEMFVSERGIGYYIADAQQALKIKEMWSAIFVLMIVSFAANTLFLRFERAVLRWHRGAHEVSAV